MRKIASKLGFTLEKGTGGQKTKQFRWMGKDLEGKVPFAKMKADRSGIIRICGGKKVRTTLFEHCANMRMKPIPPTKTFPSLSFQVTKEDLPQLCEAAFNALEREAKRKAEAAVEDDLNEQEKVQRDTAEHLLMNEKLVKAQKAHQAQVENNRRAGALSEEIKAHTQHLSSILRLAEDTSIHAVLELERNDPKSNHSRCPSL
jgi:hypothetical protein